MKKIFTFILAFVATTCLWAYDFKSGDLYYNITSSTAPYTVEVTYQENQIYKNYPGLTTAIIPETVTNNGTTYSVTSIGDRAFWCCSQLNSITIPSSVLTIGKSAFYCASLDSIIIPNSVTSIGYSAFAKEGRGSIRFVVIGENVATIGDWAFGCQSKILSIKCLAENPPLLGTEVFSGMGSSHEGVSSETPIYVPCGSIDIYNSSSWNYFKNIQGPLAEYSINVMSMNDIMGDAKVDRNDSCANQISATANYGYHFVQWSDGNTDNPRSLELTQDTILTAEFAPNNYTISTLCNDTERGTTSGDVTTTYLDYVTISATANYGYHFSHWNDYNYDNPRQVQVTKDKTYTAYFDKNTYYITKHYDSNQGYVDGYPFGEYLDNITLTAEPNYGYHFVRWSDGNTDNPRHFVLTQDTTVCISFVNNPQGRSSYISPNPDIVRVLFL